MVWLIFNDFHIKFRAKLNNNIDEDVEPTLITDPTQGAPKFLRFGGARA